MKKYLIAILIITLFLSGCTEIETTQEKELTEVQVRTYQKKASVSGKVASLLSDLPEEKTPVELRTMATVELKDDLTVLSDVAEGAGIYLSGNIVMITSPGQYRFTGQLSNGQIWVSSEDNVCLSLEGVDIHCEDMPAIELHGGGNMTIALREGTKNRLSDGEGRSATAKDKKGVVTFLNTLTVTGSGELEIVSKYENAFSVGGLQLLSTNVTVTECPDKALQSEDFILVSHSILTTLSQEEGLVCGAAVIMDSRLKTGGISGERVSVVRSELKITGKGDGIAGKNIVSVEESGIAISVDGDGIVAERGRGEEGIVRLVSSDITVRDGDDGIKAKYLVCPSGTFFAYGPGAQLNLSEGADCYSDPKEVMLYAAVEGWLRCGEKQAEVDACENFVYIGVATEDGALYVNDEKYALLW